MALTYTPVAQFIAGDHRFVVTAITFDSSYPTGGEDIAPSSFGMQKIDTIITEPSTGLLTNYAAATGKLRAHWFDYDAVGDGAAVEVPNGTNLAAHVVRALVIGR